MENKKNTGPAGEIVGCSNSICKSKNFKLLETTREENHICDCWECSNCGSIHFIDSYNN